MTTGWVSITITDYGIPTVYLMATTAGFADFGDSGAAVLTNHPVAGKKRNLSGLVVAGEEQTRRAFCLSTLPFGQTDPVFQHVTLQIDF